MREFFEDNVVNKKYINLEISLSLIFMFILIIFIFMFILFMNNDMYIYAFINILFIIGLFKFMCKYDDSNRKKYNKIFKNRSNYYVFDMDNSVSYEELVKILDNIKKRDKKMYIKEENNIIFRLKSGFLYQYIYRINVIKCDNFNIDIYQDRLKKLNYVYDKRFGTDRENYRKYGKHPVMCYPNCLHRINFIYCKELNKELEDFISKNAYYYLNVGFTSQTILIIDNKMYVPTVRTTVIVSSLKKYIKTIKMVCEIMKIKS